MVNFTLNLFSRMLGILFLQMIAYLITTKTAKCSSGFYFYFSLRHYFIRIQSQMLCSNTPESPFFSLCPRLSCGHNLCSIRGFCWFFFLFHFFIVFFFFLKFWLVFCLFVFENINIYINLFVNICESVYICSFLSLPKR